MRVWCSPQDVLVGRREAGRDQILAIRPLRVGAAHNAVGRCQCRLLGIKGLQATREDSEEGESNHEVFARRADASTLTMLSPMFAADYACYESDSQKTKLDRDPRFGYSWPGTGPGKNLRASFEHASYAAIGFES